MILLRNLAFARGGEPLVEEASLAVHPGWKVALTGANGCGKSSFLALLTGGLHAEAGDLELPATWTIAHVAQETPALSDRAIDFVLDGDFELRHLEKQIAEAEAAHAGERLAELHARYQDIGGWSAPARAAALLAGLGFAAQDQARTVAQFSGGWRVRLNLARALMCRSDLLLLDEPTNHLDLDAVLWLEAWLKDYRGTILMISHDRDFVDAVVDHVLHIENRRLKLYSGNWSTFERTRAENLAQQQAMRERQERERAHLNAFVERFRAKATKARQAQSRLKALARMQEIAIAHVDMPFHFRFPPPEGVSDPLLALDRVDGGYCGQAIVRQVSLTLHPGSRIGLLGRNGAGKSTLVKLLAGELAPLVGQRREGRHLRIGYFAQHQLETLRADESPLQQLQRLAPAAREQELRDWLGSFGFGGEQATAPCGRFSGGEKSRLALALMIYQKPNLLLLDEPTNHLDLEMREALTLALQETETAVVLVSHDRHLLRTTCDELWLVGEGCAQPFEGDLDDYARLVTAARQTAVESKDKTARRQAREQAAADRQTRLVKRRPMLKELEALEKNLAVWQDEKSQIDQRLADPDFYVAGEKLELAALLKRQSELATLIEKAEERWLALHEALEALVID